MALIEVFERTASSCACSTAAAARSVAAAGRATRPSWRSRRAPCRAGIRVTEQGEVIAGKVLNPELGRQQPRPSSRASLEAALLHPQDGRPRAEFIAAMEELSATPIGLSRAGLRDAGFDRYFWDSTVIAEIANLHIGSRPASRKKSMRVEDLRAIPWVFGWAQCRLMLAGMVRFRLRGHGLDSGATPGPAWRCCRHGARMAVLPDALSNMDMVLAKSDIGSPRATRTGGGCAIAGAIFCRLCANGRVPSRRCSPISTSAAAGAQSALARTIRDRFPYIDPLNHVHSSS
jgi:phosphoenolpyruvate carboxylase